MERPWNVVRLDREHQPDRRDQGQTSSELMGILVVIALIIGVLAPSGLGGQLADDIRVLICRIAGQSCSAGTTAISHVPEECTTLSHSEQIKADVTVFSVNVGGSGKLTLTKTVDSSGKTHWFVQQEGEGHLGAKAIFGESAGVGDLGEGLKASVTAALTGSAGAKYEFPTEQAARDFLTAARDEPAKRAVVGPFDPFGFGKKLLDKIDGVSYDPPPPTETFYAGGALVSGTAEGKAGVAALTGNGSVTALLGVKVKSATPASADGSVPARGETRTVYLQVSSEAAAQLGVFETVSGTIGDSSEVVVGIEYDDTGKAISATLDATGTLTGQLGLGATGGEKGQPATPLTPAVPKGTTGAGDLSIGGGKAGTLQMRVDLTQGNNRDVVADGLHSIGVPVLMNDGTGSVDPVTGLTGMYRLFEDGAPGTTLGVVLYSQNDGGLSGGVEGGEGIGFGIEGGVSTQDRSVDRAAYFQPGQGFVTWEQCSQ
ncbi:MAG: hypothetical protein IPJ14_06300 [Kineosporiaceae bacterium]|nr:hypothetical protein [Kineosporiaceae bacterium]MBK8074602.1 hypothetical protein [Kineosporiaceae bacterium]